jgi:hypothetical protein
MVEEKTLEEARDGPIRGEEARHLVGGGEAKIFRRVEDGPMGERVLQKDPKGERTREGARKDRKTGERESGDERVEPGVLRGKVMV